MKTTQTNAGCARMMIAGTLLLAAWAVGVHLLAVYISTPR